MANKIPGHMDSFAAGADLRTAQWKGVTLSGLNTVILQGASGLCLGVLQNKPNTGESACVMQSGRTPVYANGSGTAIAVGDMVGPDTTGIFVKKAAAAANIVGIAQEACTVNGGIISVTLTLDIH